MPELKFGTVSEAAANGYKVAVRPDGVRVGIGVIHDPHRLTSAVI